MKPIEIRDSAEAEARHRKGAQSKEMRLSEAIGDPAYQAMLDGDARAGIGQSVDGAKPSVHEWTNQKKFTAEKKHVKEFVAVMDFVLHAADVDPLDFGLRYAARLLWAHNVETTVQVGDMTRPHQPTPKSFQRGDQRLIPPVSVLGFAADGRHRTRGLPLGASSTGLVSRVSAG